MTRSLGRSFGLVLLVTACSGGASAPDARPSTDAATRDASGPDAAGPNGDAGPPADATPPNGNEGLVAITQGAPVNQITAVFARGSYRGVAGASDGACTVYTDPFHARAGGAFDAGTVTITGTKDPHTLVPSGHSYPALDVPAVLFAAGDAITASAAGSADLPPFAATVAAPAPLLGFRAPTPPDAISRAAGVDVKWTAGSGDFAWVAIVSTGTTGQTWLICEVPDSGTIHISPAQLALLPAFDDKALAAVIRVNDVIAAAGAFRVHVQAQTTAIGMQVGFRP